MEEKLSSLWISKDLRWIKCLRDIFLWLRTITSTNTPALGLKHTHSQASLSDYLAAEYSQVVGESAEPGWDGGQPSPGAVCTPIFIAAARGRTNGRRLPLTGGTGSEEAPQTYPKQIHTHFDSLRFRWKRLKGSFGSLFVSGFCGWVYSGRRLLMWSLGGGMKR